MRIIIKAPAKINLGLAVLGRRPDGYHDLKTIMQQISLADTVVLIPRRHQSGWRFYCTQPDLAGTDNLVCRAASLLESIVSKPLPGVDLILYKAVPVQAGLGGGSSDAAAALMGLNMYWQLGLNRMNLLKLGAQLGADVPFCLIGGTAAAGARGDEVEPLPYLPFYWVVLALPAGLRFSTAAVYGMLGQEWDRPDLDVLLDAVRHGSRAGIENWLASGRTNTLESVLLPRYPELVSLKERFRQAGLLPALSGSGPALFAFTRSYRQACIASRMLGEDGADTYIAWTLKKPV